MSAEIFSQYARYYELFYREKNYANEVSFVDRLLRDTGVVAGTLLDIGCGTGGHAQHFARLGWRVVGGDLSPQMIEIARRNSPVELGLEFFTGAASEFSLGRTFAAVVSLFHVVSYQATREEALKMFINVRRHLVSGGCFVFDFWHGPGVLADPPRVRVQRYETQSVRLVRIAEPFHNAEHQTVNVAYEVLIEDRETRKLDRVQELHRLRYFGLPEIEDLLGIAGFRLLRSYAGMTDAALSPTSWYGLVAAVAE